MQKIKLERLPYIMNFLAHLYLSGSDQGVMLGNFMGDFVKGRDPFPQYGRRIGTGILLHRSIDEFTDTHSIVKESKQRLRSRYRHYAGVLVDIYYDHFLAARWNEYAKVPLTQFADEAYQLVLDRQELVPERVRQMMPHMIRGNWLVNYAHFEGIHRVLQGMSRRTTFNSGMEHAVEELREHYDLFGDEFSRFFPELKAHCDQWLLDNQLS